MDDLICDFLEETKEGLSSLDNDIVSLEQNPNDEELIGNIFRIMHTIKGTCGFLGLSKLEKVAHAGENILDNIRGGKLAVSPEIISIILECIDCIKTIVEYIDENEEEPDEDYQPLADRLNAAAEGEGAADAVPKVPVAEAAPTEQLSAPAPAESAGAVEDEEDDVTDSDDLQALFDATPGPEGIKNAGDSTPAAPPATTNVPPKEEGGSAEDNDDLQALFDATETLVDMGDANKAASASSVEASPAETPAQPAAQAAVEAPKPEVKKEEKKDEPKPKDQAAKKSGSQTIRVSVDVLENLMNQASELVLTRNQLLQIVRKMEDNDLAVPLQRLNYITTELQEGVMKTRMQPIGSAWAPLPRIIRDLSVDLGKKIQLNMSGEDTELDRQLLEYIKDPLTHMIRNSADHGLEGPEGRAEAGKSDTGQINLRAFHEGGFIIIEIADDGKGLNVDMIKNKAILNGLATESEISKLSDHVIYQFIFKPGFSTAEQVTSVSGRGVGMDVVRNNIEKIGGTIELRSTPGKGTTFVIKIPLTLAIMSILVVGSAQQRFAIPQISIEEVVRVGKKSHHVIEMINKRPILRLRGKLLPLIDLSETLGIGESDLSQSSNVYFIVVCKVGGSFFGIIVDKVFDTEEIVVKPVSPALKNIEVYSGSTLLGDGSVIMVLDLNGLGRQIAQDVGSDDEDFTVRGSVVDRDAASFVLFKAGDDTPKLVPLDLVSRLEELEASSIELSRGFPVVQYRDKLMHLTTFDGFEMPQEGIIQVLVFTNQDKILGLVVENIEDIVKTQLDQKLSSAKEGFLGSLVVNGKTCDIVDVQCFFHKIFSDWDEIETEQDEKGGSYILFIDDSPFFRKFIPPELTAEGFNVKTIETANQAVDILEEDYQNVSAIVTDINMPGMDGLEFTFHCKSDARFKNIPIVILSSHKGEEQQRDRELMEHVLAYIPKTDHAELTKILKSALQEA